MKKEVRAFLLGMVVATILLGSFSLAGNYSETVQRYFRDIKIRLNGTEVIPKDANGKVVEPFIIDGTTYLPVRAIGEAMDLEVNWDAETSTIILGKHDAVFTNPPSEEENLQRLNTLRQDMTKIQEAVKDLAEEYQSNPQEVSLVGYDLSNNPQTIVASGVTKVYQEGYYLLNASKLIEFVPEVALKGEYYFINYDTMDVVNVQGVRYQDHMYHTLEELLSL